MIKYALALLLSVLFAAPAGAQVWRVVTPEESELISSNTGERIFFPNVLLPTGMNYRVETSNAAKVSNSNDSCDARYYFNGALQLAPNAVFPDVGLKIKYDNTNESFFQPPVANPLQPGYQASHRYQANVTSAGTILGFRFFDRVDPPNAYYDDNRDFIAITVAQGTPKIAAYRDTLKFGAIAVSTQSTLPDSIESYGREGLNVIGVDIIGANASEFSFTSQHGNQFVLNESLTNAFTVTFSPQTFGPKYAELHVHTSNGFGADSNRIIVLIGQAQGVVLAATPDTLDLGNVRVGSTRTLSELITDQGNTDATIVSAVVTPSTNGFTVGGLPTTAAAHNNATVPITFAPLVAGPALAQIVFTASDGTTLTMYVKGRGVTGTLFLSADTLDFGVVIFGQSKALADTLINIGAADLKLESIVNTSPGEFNVIGNMNPRTVPAGGSGEIYTVTFTPNVHIPSFIHTAELQFRYDGGQLRTVYLIGREHTPLEADLRIDSFYLVKAGENVTVRQKLTTDVSKTVTPVRVIKEKIMYDPAVLSVNDVQKGPALSASDWTFNWTNPLPGEIDIVAHAGTSQLGPPGTVLSIDFHVLENDQPGNFSYLPQQPVLGGGFEPTVVVSPGKIVVIGLCGPARLQSGNSATMIVPISPNPVYSSAQLRYWIAGEASHTLIQLFDATGALMRTIVDRDEPAGEHHATLSVAGLESGMYTAVLEAGGVRSCLRVAIVK